MRQGSGEVHGKITLLSVFPRHACDGGPLDHCMTCMALWQTGLSIFKDGAGTVDSEVNLRAKSVGSVRSVLYGGKACILEFG
jgi:hypothetical protein